MAILFKEEGLASKTMFYGTDINSEALEKAERGIYPLSQVPLFTKNHQLAGGKTSLSDYYSAAYGSVAFDKSLRERVVFSDHSLVTDAVFAEVQLISCRNVLIYFDRDLQDRAIGLFRDSLVHLVREHDTAILLVSHELGAVADDLDHVLVLKRSIVFDGPPGELAATGVSLGVHHQDLPLWLEELR